MSRRLPQLNAAMQQLIAEIISQKIEVPFEYFVTVTKVDCAPDIKTAKVFISVLPFSQAEEGLKFMRRQRAEIQRHLAPKMKTKFLPILNFFLDDSNEVANNIYSQLDALEQA